MPIYPAPKGGEGYTTDELEEIQEKTHLIGDDPEKSQEVLQKQAEEDRIKREERERKLIQEAINNNMEKHKNAMQDTMYEIMNGRPRPKEKKKESDS